MTKCVYNTDQNWLRFLRSKSITGPVNFWRKDKRAFRLASGSLFYFRIRPTTRAFIAGHAKFETFKVQTAREAWEEFGLRNGVPEYDQFLASIQRVLNIPTPTDSTEIASIVLDNCVWYPEADVVEIPESVFPRNILASKFFQDEELGFLPPYAPTGPVPELPDEDFPEGNKSGRLHLRVERSSALIKKVKGERPWVCDICRLDFNQYYGKAYIEAHHKVPLAWRGGSISRAEDIALLCPNCHHAVHRYMRDAPDMTYESIRQAITELLSLP